MPDYTVVFVRLVLIEQMISVLVPPLWIAANATGKIKKNQIYGRMFTLAALPLSYGLLRIIESPIIPMVILILSSVGYWAYCLYDIHNQIDLDISKYLKKSIMPVAVFAIIIATVNSLSIEVYGTDNFFRLLIVMFATIMFGCVGCYCILEKEEKKVVKRIIKKKL